jgi:hypothetical protein
VLGLIIIGSVVLATEAWLLADRQAIHLAAIVGLLGSVTYLAGGIILNEPLAAGLGSAGITVFFGFWWGGRGRRKRTREALGDESRQMRDGLVRWMRQRRITRPGWSPSPSPSP